MKKWITLCGMALSSAAAIPAYASAEKPPVDPLQNLLDNKVYSVSRVLERAFDAPAAIYVVSSEDIKRLGAQSVPEALRIVPGLQVARINSHTWAISARGFNFQFTNKLLVMIDGRTIYTPLFSGVRWDANTPPIENIDKIEVILGPGGTLWGANAVNGVINILTKEAGATIGKRASVTVGSDHNRQAFYRVGTQINKDLFMRSDVQYFNNQDSTPKKAGGPEEALEGGNSNFRIDWSPASDDSVSIDAQIGRNRAENYANNLPIASPPYSQRASYDAATNYAHINTKWDHWHAKDSLSTLSAYLNYEDLDINILGRQEYTFNTDYQNSFYANDANRITWGGGFRLISDDIQGSEYITYNDLQRTDELYSLFAQNRYEMVNDLLFLTYGTKIEHNAYTGVEVQPNVRLALYPTEKQMAWAAVSRAVRTPSRGENGARIFVAPDVTNPGNKIIQTGNDDFAAERLTAYELGYRIKPTNQLLFDLKGFYNVYDDLRTFVIEPGDRPLVSYRMNARNLGEGESYGFEAMVEWQATDDLKLEMSYDWLKIYLQGQNNKSYAGLTADEGSSPQQQARFMAQYSITSDVHWTTALYLVDALPYPNIDGYDKLDTTINWQATDIMNLALSGTNLMDNRHLEFSPGLYNVPQEIGRTVYLKVSFNY